MTDRNLIQVSGTVLINRSAGIVFDFLANPCNDRLWRTEINRSILDGYPGLGVSVSEYSNLSKKAPDHLLQLKCVEFDRNRSAVFKTPDHAAFYLKSQRLVNAVSATQTEVFYKLDFDKKIVKQAIGFSLPKFIVAYKARSDMKKYLLQLKHQLENG